MNELIKVVGLAKIRVDAGFSRVGRRLSGSDPADRAFMTLSARVLAVGNAVVVLCRDGHSNEALPLLRALAEFALLMRWTAAADSGARASASLAELSTPLWDGLWREARSRELAESFGVPAWAVEAAFASAPDFSRGNAAGLPWGHIFQDGQPPGRRPEAVLAAAAIWLSVALEALDRRWPGDFPGAAEMRDQAQISRGQ